MVMSIYNYKGGVFKTPLSINIATSLVKSGYRTMLVDADSQCNLTTFFPETDVSGASGASGANDQPEADVGMDSDEPLIGRHPINRDAQPVEHFTHHDNMQHNIRTMVQQFQESDDKVLQLPAPYVVPNYNENLLLLPGSYYITQLDDELGEIRGSLAADNTLNFPTRTNRYVGAFRKMINTMISEWQLDYVIVDCAPANSSLNKIIAMTSDYILPVAFPDLFSTRSVQELLTNVLPSWYDWRQQVVDYQARAGTLGGRNVEFKLDVIMQQAPRILPFLVLKLDLVHSDVQCTQVQSTQVQCTRVTNAMSKWVRGLEALVSDHVPERVRGHFRPNRGAMVIPFLRNKPVRDGQQDYVMAQFTSLIAFLEYVRTNG